MNLHRVLSVSDVSGPGEARRVAVGLASSIGFDEEDSGRVALIVTEAATNIVKHASKGHILLRRLGSQEQAGIEVIALDRGPGMADVALCRSDGYSTAGSAGIGLGAISRLASFLDLYSAPQLGTALLARVLPRGVVPPSVASPFITGAVRVPAPGETQCGDDWAILVSKRQATVLVADGLGHGPEAAKAAATALRVFRDDEPPDEVLSRVNLASQTTRGVAASCARIDLDAQLVGFAGVGNVGGLLAWAGGKSRHMVGQNGTLGVQLGRIRTMSYPMNGAACLIMHTDGLTTHTDPQNYPGLLVRDPGLIAAVLYRDFARGRDDATVVVTRQVGPEL